VGWGGGFRIGQRQTEETGPKKGRRQNLPCFRGALPLDFNVYTLYSISPRSVVFCTYFSVQPVPPPSQLCAFGSGALRRTWNPTQGWPGCRWEREGPSEHRRLIGSSCPPFGELLARAPLPSVLSCRICRYYRPLSDAVLEKYHKLKLRTGKASAARPSKQTR